MARLERLKVEPHPALRPERLYAVCVANIDVHKRRRQLSVRVQFVGGEQEGRIEEFFLPIPIRPTGLTADFFEAAGLSVQVGSEITPKTAVGKMLGIRFACAGAEIKPAGFSRQIEEVNRDAGRK